MMRRKQMFSVLALVAPFAVGAVMASPIVTVSNASAQEVAPNLCENTRYVCEHTSINAAPVLRANVCWDGVRTTLAGSGGCSTGSLFYLSFGEVVDPLTNTVAAYSPLKDTCEMGYCSPDGIDASDIIIDGVACCNPKTGVCEAPDEDGLCTVGDITWCEKLEDNGDGTITCHE
jgi:hypothetical protein